MDSYTVGLTTIKDKCDSCNKKRKTTVFAVYYWRMKLCKQCETLIRKNGHIK